MQAHDEHDGQQTHDALSWEISRQEVQGYLKRLAKEVAQSSGRPVDVRIEQGQPAERVIDLAREIDADLILLGSYGETGVTPWNLGSTVQQVLAVTRSSVFVVHSFSVAPAKVTLKRILVPLDGSLRTESILPAAARMASAHGAELLLVHVVHESLPTTLLYTAEDIELAQKLAVRLEAGAKQYLERLQQQLAHDVASVRTFVVRHANERRCLLEISKQEESDLIVLSAHGSDCDSVRPFGSVTTYLLIHSAVPLLVLQDLPEYQVHRTLDVEAKLAPPALRASYASETV